MPLRCCDDLRAVEPVNVFGIRSSVRPIAWQTAEPLAAGVRISFAIARGGEIDFSSGQHGNGLAPIDPLGAGCLIEDSQRTPGGGENADALDRGIARIREGRLRQDTGLVGLSRGALNDRQQDKSNYSNHTEASLNGVFGASHRDPQQEHPNGTLR